MEPPIRLLMVTPRYPPERGGVETHVSEVARRLGALGFRVTVLATDRSRTMPRFSVDGDVDIVRVSAWPRQRDYYVAPGIARITWGEWDLVHVQGMHTLVAPLAMATAWLRGIPFVVTLHSGGHSSRWRSAMRPLQLALLRPLLVRARRVIAVSGFEAAYFRGRLGLTGSRLSVIPNGSDLPAGIAPVRRVGERLIVSPGRLERYKGHDRVVEAMPSVLAACPSARLAILGDGPDAPRLAALAERLGVAHAVEIGPAVDRADYAGRLAGADLVTQLSRYESQGVAVSEALALGKPVIAAAAAALAELHDEPLVELVRLDVAPVKLAHVIIRRLAEPGERVPRRASTWDACTAALVGVYRAALSA